jgi:uncharacterized protein
MKILAFSDVHGSMKALSHLRKRSLQAELVLCCGDISIFEQDLPRLVHELSHFKVPVLVLPGNHEPSARLKKLCSQHKNLVYMDNRIFESDELFVFGSQGNGFALVDRQFEAVHKAFMPKLKERKGKDFILMTHAPPYGTALDRIGDGHTGNKSIRRFIMETKPVLAFSGHIHENRGRKDKLGRTVLLNPGPAGIMVTLDRKL